ncbi:hypothetical protein IV203_002761 [Nitzschia inconspicua]|uniref:Uncharacterized protein n=1 Tax=Nitzschia inconspicua TaxID=303405 RepID=A0A9K3L209_9STRA|nr:hypothetical protein IV203_002761 [Nitzschia inconspicua]
MIFPPRSSILVRWMFCFLFIGTIILPSSVHGYASWLKCFLELDEEEIVMHHPMKPPQDAEYEVFLEIQPYGESTWTVADEYTLLTTSSKDVTATSATTIQSLKVRLRVPPALKLEEVQYVVEVQGPHAVFVDLGVMCDGKRAFSRSYDEHVVLQINTTTTSEENDTTTTTDDDNNDIRLLAGWAHTYGPVSLTQAMTIKQNAVDSKIGEEL